MGGKPTPRRGFSRTNRPDQQAQQTGPQDKRLMALP